MSLECCIGLETIFPCVFMAQRGGNRDPIDLGCSIDLKTCEAFREADLDFLVFFWEQKGEAPHELEPP